MNRNIHPDLEIDLPAPVKEVRTRKPGNMDSNSKRAVALDNAIGFMIAADFQPYSLVENRGFQNLMSVAVPTYSIHPA